MFRASATLLYCLLLGDYYFPLEHFCFSSSLFTLITSVSLCICIIQNNPIPRVMSRFVNLDSSTLDFKNVRIFRALDPLWVFCLRLQWSSFISSCGYPWNGLTETADQTSFHSLSWGRTTRFKLDLFCGSILLCSGLPSKRWKQSNVLFQEELLAWNCHRCFEKKKPLFNNISS